MLFFFPPSLPLSLSSNTSTVFLLFIFPSFIVAIFTCASSEPKKFSNYIRNINKIYIKYIKSGMVFRTNSLKYFINIIARTISRTLPIHVHRMERVCDTVMMIFCRTFIWKWVTVVFFFIFLLTESQYPLASLVNCDNDETSLELSITFYHKMTMVRCIHLSIYISLSIHLLVEQIHWMFFLFQNIFESQSNE